VIGGWIKGPIREAIRLATRSQLARRSLGVLVLRQQLDAIYTEKSSSALKIEVRRK
jgi:hypothetical protein